MGIGNWKIGVRLAAGLGLALAFMVGISVTGIVSRGKSIQAARLKGIGKRFNPLAGA